MITTKKIPKLSSLVKAAEFDWVNSSITDDLFPIPDPEIMGDDYKLFRFDKNILSEDALTEMVKDGFRPANAWELATYAKDSWNGKDWVVGLGSLGEVDGYRIVPFLCRVDSGRNLRLGWCDGAWGAGRRFLGVRNDSPALGSSESGPSDALTLGASGIIPDLIKQVKSLEDWARGIGYKN